MHDKAIGRAVRVIRVRLGMRQEDLARLAGCSQSEISRIELGELAGITLGRARRIAAALDATLTSEIRWRGGELDRLLDEDHAALVGVVARLLGRHAWQVETEVTFSIYGERGSIDLLAWHAPSRTLVVIEVKTEIASIEEMERRLDAKVRLAPRIWAERGGERPRAVGRLLVVADGSTNRRRVARHDAILGARYPMRGSAVRAWLRAPTTALSGLLFLAARGGGASFCRRVRRRPAVSDRSGRSPAGTP